MLPSMSQISRRSFLTGLMAAGVSPLLPALADQSGGNGASLIIDGHVDLGWNIVNYGRDYRRSALDIRADTAGTFAQVIQGQATLGLPEWFSGHVALMLGVIFVIPSHLSSSSLQIANYSTPEEAQHWGLAMLDAIEAFAEDTPEIQMVASQEQLSAVWDTWLTPPTTGPRIGIVLAMEGADPIQSPDELAQWHERGLRSVGLSWGHTRYAGGNFEPGGLTDAGRDLLREMQALNMLFDTAHLAEAAFWDALDIWQGTIAYTHGNVRYFLPTERGLTDDQIRALAERDGVIGISLYTGHFERNLAHPPQVTLDDVVNAIDYVCQLTGSCEYVAIGSDLDGAFGAEATPQGIDTVADLQQIVARLRERGFAEADINRITHDNWLRLLRRVV